MFNKALFWIFVWFLKTWKKSSPLSEIDNLLYYNCMSPILMLIEASRDDYLAFCVCHLIFTLRLNFFITKNVLLNTLVLKKIKSIFMQNFLFEKIFLC